MIPEIVIADASCLIVLENIRELSLLQKLFNEVFITTEVKDEAGFELPDWVRVRNPQNTTLKNTLSLILDTGEAGAITLAMEFENSLLIIDEKKGRRVAAQLGLKIIGTFGVILKAVETIPGYSTKDLITRLEAAGFYLSKNLKTKFDS